MVLSLGLGGWRANGKGESLVSKRNHSLLSEETKQYLARIQGAGDRAHPYDYGELTSREAGNFTKYAVAAAEELLSQRVEQSRLS